MLPLDDRTVELFGARFADHTPHRPDRRYRYRPPMSYLPAQASAAIGGRSWDMTATVDRAAGEGGVLYALGNGNAGLCLFVQDDHLVFDYNAFGEHTIVESDAAVPVGRSMIGVQFRREGAGARATLVIDGDPVGSIGIGFAMSVVSSVGSSVGYDHGLPVSDRYDGTFPFGGSLLALDIELISVDRAQEREVAAADERTGMAQQ